MRPSWWASGRMAKRRIHPAGARAELLAGRAEDRQAAVPLRVEHQHAHQSAQGGRDPHGRHGAVGQVSRAGQCAGADDPSDAWERLRTRHAEREAIPGLHGCAGATRADDGRRSRAHRPDDPRWAGSGHTWADSIRVVGVRRRRDEVSVRSGAGEGTVDEADGATPTAMASANARAVRPASHAHHAGGFHGSRERRRRCSGSRDVGADMSIALHDGTTISQIWFEGRLDAMLHWWQMPRIPS